MVGLCWDGLVYVGMVWSVYRDCCHVHLFVRISTGVRAKNFKQANKQNMVVAQNLTTRTAPRVLPGSAMRPTIRRSIRHTIRAAAVPDGSVSVVLLSGGVGKRFGASIPKQYVELLGRPIATYSMETFSKMPAVSEIVVVCEEEWRSVFEQEHARLGQAKPISFAKPGAERQDSVYNGFVAISPNAELVAIHDSARPMVTAEDTIKCAEQALEVGAATLGVKVKPTIKEVDENGRVVKTLDRSRLVEIHTPQIIRPALLAQGFEAVKRDGLEVTDDVSIIEQIGKPVQIVEGSYENIKVTTPEDLEVATGFMASRKS